MQITFRAALKRAVEGHRLYGDLLVFYKLIDMHDLYQGSRLFQLFLELVSTSVCRMKVTLLPAGLRLADELLENPDLPKLKFMLWLLAWGNVLMPWCSLDIFLAILSLQGISLMLSRHIPGRIWLQQSMLRIMRSPLLHRFAWLF